MSGRGRSLFGAVDSDSDITGMRNSLSGFPGIKQYQLKPIFYFHLTRKRSKLAWEDRSGEKQFHL